MKVSLNCCKPLMFKGEKKVNTEAQKPVAAQVESKPAVVTKPETKGIAAQPAADVVVISSKKPATK